MIDQIKLRHQKVHRNHSHKGRKHSEHHRNLHHRFARRERKTRHGIGGQNHQKRAEDAAACRHKKCIGKPARIVVQCRIRKQPFEARQTVSGREKTVKRIDRSRFGKRCQDQPETREKNTNATAVRIRYVMPVSIILPNFHFLLIEMCPPLRK